MASRIHFVKAARTEPNKAVAEKVRALFSEAGLAKVVGKNDLTAVKIHFGEPKNDTHIPPEYAKPVIREIRQAGGNPFFTDTCVLYKSARDNAVNHLRVARDHGFTIDKTDAPVVIADGLFGCAETDVGIPGKIFKNVSIASAAVEAGSMIVLSHVTGHMLTGLGAAIKNLGMGLASRKGKMRQHSATRPVISEKACTGCGVCIEWCPQIAIAMHDKKAKIDPSLCIGCGECLAVCRFDAVEFDWNVDGRELSRRMTEHALGAVIGKKGKVGYMNFILSVTKECDCGGFRQKSLFEDIGILSGFDPVAIDAASLDIIRGRTGKELSELSHPELDSWEQIRHGELIGLGSAKYELAEIKGL
jgi:uncharacterized Fe-S center protein